MRHHEILQPPLTKKGKNPTTLAQAHTRLLEAEKLRQAGQLDKATSICEALLREFPDYVGALQTLGAILLVRKNYWQALSCFTKAAMRCPKDAINLTNLASVYVALEAKELAAMTLDMAIALNPDDPEIHYTLGEIYREDREYEQAARSYERALALAPDHALAANGLGESYSNLGRYVEAAAAHESVHKLRPESIGCLYGLTQLPASVVSLDLMTALDRIRQSNRQNDEEFRSHFAFTLAAALSRRDLHKEAWGKLLEANRIEYPNHEAAYRRQLALQEARRQEALKHRVSDRQNAVIVRPLSLFIIGPSRSGKTTLERLVSNLPGVKRGYESHLIERAAKRASQHSGLLTLSNLNDLPHALEGEFRKYYLEELREFAGGSAIFTNTHPAMIHSVGRVASALPNARFIFVKREPYDIALRIFGKRYKSGNQHAYNIKTIFDYVGWYYQMVDIWHEKLPSVSRIISYEEIIADPATALSTAAELCGVTATDIPLPDLGDDRDCAASYREFIAAAAT